MIAELGHFALILALCVALPVGILPWRSGDHVLSLARRGSVVLAVLLLLSFTCLAASFVQHDFSVLYVAQHGHTSLPLAYRIAAVWGGHEGSLLLWVVLLGLWSLAVAWRARGLPATAIAQWLAVLALVQAGLLLFIVATSNPFVRLLPAAAEGRDLNPLLQDPGLVLHPPLLYMGYVGYAVSFALAMVGLVQGRLDADWLRCARPWALAAWLCLTLGIALGSYWAYYELGWGGWWFWDPVENASFMPWLIGTALLHALALSERRGVAIRWTVLLAISAFALSLLGTFLVRSGVLSSVHAFASDPRRGLFILLLLVVVVGVSLVVYASRASRLPEGPAFALLSRETLLLTQVVLLAVAAASVLLGTLYPLAIDALGLGKLSVGAPYFNAVFVPLMLPVLLLVTPGTLCRWQQDQPWHVLRQHALPLATGSVAAVMLPGLFGPWQGTAALGVGIATGMACAIVQQSVLRSRRGWPGGGYWGMQLAHLGLAVFVTGVTVVSHYQVERDVSMRPGDHVMIAGLRLDFTGLSDVAGSNYIATRGAFTLYHADTPIASLQPEKRRYLTSEMPMTEAAIDTGWWRDIYVSLGEPLDDTGHWAVRVYYKPCVSWIWGGCLLMALGALCAASDRRYRTRPQQEAA